MTINKSKTDKLMTCCICRNDIPIEPLTGWAYGHNAQPIFDSRCCSQCNDLFVIPTRMRRAYPQKPQADKTAS